MFLDYRLELAKEGKTIDATALDGNHGISVYMSRNRHFILKCATSITLPHIAGAPREGGVESRRVVAIPWKG